MMLNSIKPQWHPIQIMDMIETVWIKRVKLVNPKAWDSDGIQMSGGPKEYIQAPIPRAFNTKQWCIEMKRNRLFKYDNGVFEEKLKKKVNNLEAISGHPFCYTVYADMDCGVKEFKLYLQDTDAPAKTEDEHKFDGITFGNEFNAWFFDTLYRDALCQLVIEKKLNVKGFQPIVRTKWDLTKYIKNDNLANVRFTTHITIAVQTMYTCNVQDVQKFCMMVNDYIPGISLSPNYGDGSKSKPKTTTRVNHHYQYHDQPLHPDTIKILFGSKGYDPQKALKRCTKSKMASFHYKSSENRNSHRNQAQNESELLFPKPKPYKMHNPNLNINQQQKPKPYLSQIQPQQYNLNCQNQQQSGSDLRNQKWALRQATIPHYGYYQNPYYQNRYGGNPYPALSHPVQQSAPVLPPVHNKSMLPPNIESTPPPYYNAQDQKKN